MLQGVAPPVMQQQKPGRNEIAAQSLGSQDSQYRCQSASVNQVLGWQHMSLLIM